MGFADDAEMRAGLRKEFGPETITKVNKGYGEIDTINHAVVTDRLNRVDPDWTYRIEEIVELAADRAKDGLPHVLAVHATMIIGGVERREIGEAAHVTSYGDEMKKALSDFIKRGAMRFGVGIDLWMKGDAEIDETSDAYGEGAKDGEGPGAVRQTAETPVPLYDEAGDSMPATGEQWDNLLALKSVNGSGARALNRINAANKTSYTKETARAGATRGELAKAIEGGG